MFLNIPSITKNRLVNNIDNQVSTIYLDIKFKDYEKILEDRKSAIKDKHAILIDFQEVKADLIIDTENASVKQSYSKLKLKLFKT